VHKSSASNPAKKITRISCDVNEKSDTQVFMLFFSHFI
jgi:hypothetical protein